MWQLIAAFLKNIAKKAGQTALTGGKLVGKLGKEALKQTPAGQLYNAFKSTSAPTTANVGGMGKVPIAPPDYYKSQQAQINPTQAQNNGGIELLQGRGRLSEGGIPQEIQSSRPTNIIPTTQYPQFMRNQGMQYTPTGMPNIPEEYQNYRRPPADIGFLGGMKRETLSMPQPEGLENAPQGRQTAYALGGLLPRIIMSRLGQPSSAEVTGQQALAEQRKNMITPVIDPETGQILYYKPKGSAFKPTSLEEKANVNINTEAQKNLNNYASDVSQALIALKKIENYGKKLSPYGRGLLNQTGAKISSGYGTYTKDKDITRYSGVVAQEMIPMARKLMEEKGPITEFDVKRIETGFGDLTTPIEDRLMLIAEFRNKVKQALINKMQVAGLSEEEFANKYSELYKNAFQQTDQTQPQDVQSELDEIDRRLQELGGQ